MLDLPGHRGVLAGKLTVYPAPDYLDSHRRSYIIRHHGPSLMWLRCSSGKTSSAKTSSGEDLLREILTLGVVTVIARLDCIVQSVWCTFRSLRTWTGGTSVYTPSNQAEQEDHFDPTTFNFTWIWLSVILPAVPSPQTILVLPSIPIDCHGLG